MHIITGIPLSGNITIGKLRVVKQKHYKITHKHINPADTEQEIQVLVDAIRQVEDEFIELIRDDTNSDLDKEIFQTHLMIANDPDIKAELVKLITTDLMTASNAVYKKFYDIIKEFQQMENDFFAQRQDDYKDVGHRILVKLLGEKAEAVYFPEEIVCYSSITPSQVTKLAKMGVKGFVTDTGSANSHSAILARALGFSTLVIPPNKFQSLIDGSTAIIDADKGYLIIEPDGQTLSIYSDLQERLAEHQQWLSKMVMLPSETLTGKTILLKANIELAEELKLVLNNRFEGIGLYRTEFIYLSRQTMPGENDQYITYKNLLTKLEGKPVTIRTFDLGGDKLPGYSHHYNEDNPYLGCRGIRFSLYQKPMFKAQLRAILRASVFGKVQIMFPMIIDTKDFFDAKAVVLEAMAELDAESVAYDKDIPLGVMIETPSAAIGSNSLAKVCDFFSIGTNDLVQYTLAVDRNNDRVAKYYNQGHPAVISLIRLTIEAARKAGIPVSVCGEMASDSRFVPLFVGLGIDELSISPSRLPLVKSIIRSCDEQLIQAIQNFDFDQPVEVIDELLDSLRRYIPASSVTVTT